IRVIERRKQLLVVGRLIRNDREFTSVTILSGTILSGRGLKALSGTYQNRRRTGSLQTLRQGAGKAALIGEDQPRLARDRIRRSDRRFVSRLPIDPIKCIRKRVDRRVQLSDT